MSEYAHHESSPQRHGSEANLQNVSLDDASNNSIIGKVKSRVSSIIPNRLSKWFSPSAKLQNDSLNGSICGANTSLPTRRRRRIEVEEEENYEDDEDAQRCEGFEESNHLYKKKDQNDEEDDDNDSQNSEEEYNCSGLAKQTKRDLNVERQPPAKKSRLNKDVRDTPLITCHQPLLSSTPAVGNAYLRNSDSITSSSRSAYQRYTHLNLYGNQSKKIPAFNFGQQQETKSPTKIHTNIIDLISNPYENEEKLSETPNAYGSGRTAINSRKSLNIPSSTSTLTGAGRVFATVAHLKRQPLSSAKVDLSASHTEAVPPRRTSTTIQEVNEQIVEDNEQKHYDGVEKEEEITDANANNYDGTVYGSNNFESNKRQKIINGTGFNAATMSNEGILIDSASESGESAMDVKKTNSSNAQQRSTGLFNMSAGRNANTRNSSRTSSFGNGLNFYSHLEGRKSLFSGPNHGISNVLNNSTLSLTSLNRRQFNASIYGSTSALSDSRLLNTFSPFYKGKTTYGGAAAYNKYTAGAGASAVRITPTLIRPTSSLSTFSSNNSLLINVNSQVGENSTISSTAKRILDLINDFSTPLSEAKKMASSLKTNPNLHIPPQAKGRLNESDLNASRAMRLSQVRSPYSRPAVILQPSGNASGRGPSGGLLPPIKELQVPTMSQLLQMKKMQNTTEKARKIAQKSVTTKEISEYSLPDAACSKTITNHIEPEQQKHTNKIKNKVTSSLRPSAASKGFQNEEPPPTVHLPNIAFPLMQSVPKIDIQLNKSIAPCKTTTESKTLKLSSETQTSNVANIETSKNTSFSLNPTPVKSSTQTSISTTDKNVKLTTTQTTSMLKSLTTFKFSEPLQIVGVSTQSVTKTDLDKYKFSPPLDVAVQLTSDFLVHNTKPKQRELKEGSCLEALSKPILPPIKSSDKINATEATSSKTNMSLSTDFGNQFKKSTNEWECDACLIRNKANVNKCVACETPRKQTLSSSQQTASTHLATSSFGQQFKKSSNEWECDACMICNKHESTKCAACETPRKGILTQSTAAILPITNSFGDAFKPKSGTWECQTCMISNKNETNECIACQTKKSGCTTTTSSSSSVGAELAPHLKPEFATAENTNSNADTGFKTLAAQQKASKWECDACMTRNDANRTKCACCEQPKPGTTSIELSISSSAKFEFGATAASKFSFGFGTGTNAPKEEDIRKELSSKSEQSLKPSSTTLGEGTTSTAAAPALGGFQFGIKPATNSASEGKTDETDASTKSSGFKFAAPVSQDVPKKSSTAVSAPTGFIFGSKPLTTPTTTTSTSALSSASTAYTPSVKFSLPPTSTTANASNNDKPTGVAVPTFGFGTNSASSTTGGFSFGSKMEVKPAVVASKEINTSESIALKALSTIPATKSSSFIFGSSSVNSSSAAVSGTYNTTTSTLATTSTAITTSSGTTASVKPMFSFGSNTSTPPASNSQTTPAFGSFSFGSNATNNTAPNTTANTFLAAANSTLTKTTNANASSSFSTSHSTTTTPAPTSIFSSFGGGVGSSYVASTPIFGSSVNPPANNNLTSVSSSTNNSTPSKTSQFGTFGGSKATSSVFGSFGGVSGAAGGNNSALVKPNGTKPTLPVFGNVAPSNTSQTSQTNSSSFVFDSNTACTSTIVTSVQATGSVTSTSTTWPKNSFVFGTTPSTTLVNISENKDVSKPSVFGTFGSSSTNSSSQQQTSSIFGAPSLATGSAASGPTNLNLFGTNSAPAVTSIFGANSSGNAATPAPAFGSSPFGGAASLTSATPTFGSTAASGTTFGGFGGTSSNATTSTTEVKKPEAAFNFGVAPANQSTTGGFNFGSSSATTKPAFNFGGSSTTQQPTFNFTGTTESQSSTKPFQFGATPSAPVFNFNRGALEGTPNAPFQFNAGAAPVSSNIFAPAPTPAAQTAQQAKRKIRAPIRRVTQR